MPSVDRGVLLQIGHPTATNITVLKVKLSIKIKVLRLSASV